MTLHHLPHLGMINVEHITKVNTRSAHWTFSGHYARWKRDRKTGKRHGVGLQPWRDRKTGKWRRPSGYSLEHRDRIFHKATMMVWLVGDRHPLEYHFPNDVQAEKARLDVTAAINAIRAGEGDVERIVAAAVRTHIRVNDDWVGVVHSAPPPARHHTIIHAMHRLRPEPFLGEQGFITSTGRWVDRQQAMGIAVAAGQVPPEKVTAPRLFSEDLW